LCLWEESQKEEIFMFVLCLPQKILENLFLSLSLSLKRGAQNTRRRAPYQKQKHEKTIMNDKKEEEERDRFFRATTTSSTTLKKEEEEKKYATRVFLLLLALLFALLFFFSRISRSTTSSDAATQGRPVAVTMQEMRNLRYPGSTTEKKKKYHNSQYGKHSSVNLLVNTNSFFAPNIQKEKEEVKREGRKLLQFLAPVRYSLVPLSDAIQDLCEAIFDLSITPLQARIAPFLKFRETNVTDPKDPLVLDKEKVKEAIMKETLP
jgi:hypothetical protein